MRARLFGVVVHPWMTQDPEGFVWLAQVVRQRGRELSRGVGMVQEVLGGVADEGVSPELVGVFAAIEQAVSACEVLAQALGEHGVQVARLVGELESLPVGRWWQVGRLRDELRVHTDALSQVDVRVRELVQECVRGVPRAGVRRWSQVLGVSGVCGEVAVGSRVECAGLALSVLRVAVLGDPGVRVRFAREGLESVGLGVPLGVGAAMRVVELAEGAGVGGVECEAARAAVVRMRGQLGGVQVGVRVVEEVRAALVALGWQGRERLVLLWPRVVGALPGADPLLRGRANASVIRAELGRARVVDVELEARAVARRVGDASSVLRRVRSWLLSVYTGVEQARTWVALRTDYPWFVRRDLRARVRLWLRLLMERPGGRARCVWAFDAVGVGHVVELIGCWDERTRNVVVFVPGTGSGMYGFHMPERSCRVLVESDPSGQTAALCWVGDEFPTGIVNESSSGRFAVSAGRALVSDVVALGVPVGSVGVQVTVVGHSYGAAMVGAAERVGLPADVVVHLGSAGAGPGVRSVADYARWDVWGRVRRVRRFVCTAPGDPVRWVFLLSGVGVAPLGVDPRGLVGVEVFGAGVWEEEMGGHRVGECMSGAAGHMGVMTPGTTAFRRVCEIARGVEPC